MNKTIHYLGLDVHKNSIHVAIAVEEGCQLRSYGTTTAKLADLDKLIKKLQHPGVELRFCYEAGPTGYVICRHLKKRAYSCEVIAPSLIPQKPSDQVKTNRRDAKMLARLFRAGELTSVMSRTRRTRLSAIWTSPLQRRQGPVPRPATAQGFAPAPGFSLRGQNQLGARSL